MSQTEIAQSESQRSPHDEDSHDSSSSTSSESSSGRGTSVQAASSRTSIHVTVQRDQISSTNAREGDEELEGLGVDVYDQQTYERGIFDQVNRVLEQADKTARKDAVSNSSASNKTNDLLRLIHNEEDEERAAETLNVQERDEQVLQLTRQERLAKTTVKVEPAVEGEDALSRLPRIPRINQVIVKSEPVEQPSSSSAGPPDRLLESSRRACKLETASPDLELLEDGELLSSGNEDAASEYRPADDAVESTDDEELDENIAYETDSDLGDDTSTVEERPTRGGQSKKLKDDGDYRSYAARIKNYTKERARKRYDNILPDGTEFEQLDQMVNIDGSLQVPKEVWDNLYEHQKTGVRWLWELHQLGTGGILGDEMGLGKTIQMITFLIALKNSNVRSSHMGYEGLGPTVLVCPATVMHQWLLEFRKWYPRFRVAILHSTGSFSGDREQLVRVIHKSKGILICSYPGVVIYQDFLHSLDWHYAVLDEGHKIRNPDAQVTLACKRFRTPHRIILSGSPVQNNLRELWSIFDFIYPGKLGTLPVFMSQFGIPITQGGYANASDIQVQIAYKCACILRDTVKPFLLRRTKIEVNSLLKLPDRSEQVLFCKLTERQRKLYQHYLDSPTVRDIKCGRCQIFVGLIQLRKICNHPDLFDSSECDRQVKQKQSEKKSKFTEFFSADETYGHHEKSGKMMVVAALLKLWKKQGHKVLLFTQSRQMLKIFATFLNELEYKYLSMDGATPIATRHTMIDEFNSNEEVFVFLLTTRVGGVGVNLIGANRIIIYDPDWNPSTDIQARERAWRIGQKRHVMIYRLLTAGTIEEKIYHRQVFKLYLTNRVLKDAKQKRFFKTNNMHELFTLAHEDKNIETKALFDDDVQIDEESLKKSRHKRKMERMKKKEKKRRKLNLSSDENIPEATQPDLILSDEKLKEMREKAKRLSQMIAQQYGCPNANPDSNSVGPRIKLEQNPIQNNQKSPVSAPLALPTSLPNPIESNLEGSPTQSIPYCPARGGGGSKELSRDEATSSKSKKTKTKQQVDYLVKQDIYKPGTSNEDSAHKRDDYILERLFKNSNIFGALKHDMIETDSTADFKVVESEAEKVARDAIKALRESRRMCLASTFGVPNWTGKNGQIASGSRLVPKNKARAQQMASRTSTSSHGGGSILSSIKKRNQKNPINLSSGPNNSLDSEDEEQIDRDTTGLAQLVGADDMAKKIREFILFKSTSNGEAQTDELLDFFKETFDPEQTAVFKAILYKICEFQRHNDKGFWKLRSEFKD